MCLNFENIHFNAVSEVWVMKNKNIPAINMYNLLDN